MVNTCIENISFLLNHIENIVNIINFQEIHSLRNYSAVNFAILMPIVCEDLLQGASCSKKRRSIVFMSALPYDLSNNAHDCKILAPQMLY